LKKTIKFVAVFAAAALAFGAAPAATAATATKACLALDTGGVDDKSFNASAWAGAQAAAKANSNVTVKYLAATSDADYAPISRSLSMRSAQLSLESDSLSTAQLLLLQRQTQQLTLQS